YGQGVGGWVPTAVAYARFQKLMLTGGEFDGGRILGRKPVKLMPPNHIGDLPVWLTGPGYGFGLGYSVVKDIGVTGQAGSAGQYGWGRAFCTYFQVDPKEGLRGNMVTPGRR